MDWDPYQVFLAAVAIALMIVLPILFHLGLDALAGRWHGRFAAWRQRRSMGWRASEITHLFSHQRDVRALRRQTGTPIEQIARDIRRLRALVGRDRDRSAVQQIGARMAYDQVLIQACEMVGVEHRLSDQSAGLEREIERIRVEAALENCGFVLIDNRFDQAA